MSDSYYDVAQICMKGHVINDRVRDYPAHNQNYCDKCGSETVTKCSCEESIRGDYVVPGVFGGTRSYDPPKYCHKCGKPFPWTEEALEVGAQLAEEIEELSPEERKRLKQIIADLTIESPRAELAKKRFKGLSGKLGKDSYEALKGVLVNVVSEAMKKALFGV